MKPKKTCTRICPLVFLVAVAVGASINTAIADPSRPGKGVAVQPAVGNWTAAIPTSWVFVELLEELGYETKRPVSLSNPVAFLAVSQGDAHYYPNGWFPLNYTHLPDDFDENATLFEPHCPQCGINGYLVDKRSVEKYGITGLTDFVERNEVRDAFDHDDDGKAELYGCPPGWGCHETINETMDKFDLHEYIDHVDSGYTANFAEVVALYEEGESVLYYTWGPTAYLKQLVPGKDVMWINAPGIVRNESERIEGVEGAVTDPIEMGFTVNDIHVAANNQFLESNPAAKELFLRVRLPLEWISEVDALMTDQDLSDEEIRPIARQWIKDNREQVEQWLDAARSAAD